MGNCQSKQTESLFIRSIKLYREKKAPEALDILKKLQINEHSQIIAESAKDILKCFDDTFNYNINNFITELKRIFALKGIFENAEISFTIAQHYFEIQDYEQAQFWLTQTINLNSEFPLAYIKLSDSLAGQKKFEQIIPTLQLCLKANDFFFLMNFKDGANIPY